MKFKHLLLVPVLTVGFAAGLRAQQPAAAPAAPVTTGTDAAPARQFTDAQIFEMFGWYFGSRTPIAEIEPTPEHVDAFIKGVRESIADNKKAPFDEAKIGPEMQALLTSRYEAYQAKQKAKNDAYFVELKKKAGVIALPSGVMYEIVKPGTGDFPKATDTVKINYTGSLLDGTKFDSSYDRGEAAEFSLSGVIPGMTEGLQKINKGGKIKIYIPSESGYGERPPPGIPANATLVFDVELLEISAPAPQAMPAAPAAPEQK